MPGVLPPLFFMFSVTNLPLSSTVSIYASEPYTIIILTIVYRLMYFWHRWYFGIWLYLAFRSKGKAFPLQAWTGSWGSRTLRLPEFLENRHLKVAGLSALRTGRLYPPRKISGTHFCSRLIRPQGHSAARRIVTEKFQWLSGIEPATFRLVSQCLNQLRHRVPHLSFRHWFLLYRQIVSVFTLMWPGPFGYSDHRTSSILSTIRLMQWTSHCQMYTELYCGLKRKVRCRIETVPETWCISYVCQTVNNAKRIGIMN